MNCLTAQSIKDDLKASNWKASLLTGIQNCGHLSTGSFKMVNFGKHDHNKVLNLRQRPIICATTTCENMKSIRGDIIYEHCGTERGIKSFKDRLR